MRFDENSLYNIKSDFDGTRYSLFDLAIWKNGLAFKKIDCSETGRPVIKIAELNNGINSNTSFTQGDYCEDVFIRWDDLLFSWSGNPQTSIDVFRYRLQDGWLNQHIFKVTANEELVTKDFLYYVLKFLKPHFTQIAANKQTTGLGHVTIADLKRMSLVIPPKNVQSRIVSILKAIDVKIEVNTSINENLAEQAQGILYHFMDEQLYQLQPLSDIAIVIDCLHSKKPSSIEDSPYQLIQLDNIRDDGFLDMSATRYMISQVDYDNWTRKCEIVEGDCVITNVGRIGAVSQAPHGTKAAMGRNMTCIRLKPDIKLQAYFITVLLSNHMRRQIQSNTDEGTIMGALNVKNIPKLLFPIFEPTVMTELEEILFPLRKQIEYNNLQNQTLAQLRDILLPKLMSGELDVSNLDL
ncbi:MAG: restriction endonuclease subunit S [Firmicutes bacterium]|nr:restriction endonuclease subunit S [Bacillota bacterium]